MKDGVLSLFCLFSTYVVNGLANNRIRLKRFKSRIMYDCPLKTSARHTVLFQRLLNSGDLRLLSSGDIV